MLRPAPVPSFAAHVPDAPAPVPSFAAHGPDAPAPVPSFAAHVPDAPAPVPGFAAHVPDAPACHDYLLPSSPPGVRPAAEVDCSSMHWWAPSTNATVPWAVVTC